MAINRNRTYSDLDLTFTAHPVTKDIIPLRGDDAVTAALKNLILTNFYERPFHSEIGSGATGLLFENATGMTAQRLKTAIELVVKNFEPRVNMQEVIVQMLPDQNQFSVKMTYFIVNQPLPVTATMFLERVR